MANNPPPAETTAEMQRLATVIEALKPVFPHSAFQLAQSPTGVRDQDDLISQLPQNHAVLDIFHIFETSFNNMQATIDESMRAHETTKIRLAEARLAVGNGGPHVPRRITSDPPKFTGEEKNIATRQVEFLDLWSQLQRIWTQDSAIYYNDYRQLCLIPSVLSGEAASLHRDAFNSIMNNKNDNTKWKWKNVTQCCEDMEKLYVTLDLSREATREFDTLFMKGPFQNFYAKYHTLATRCGKTAEQQVDGLRMKVSKDLSDQLVNILGADHPAKDDVNGWVKLWQGIYNNLEDQKHFNKLRASHAPPAANPRGGSNNNGGNRQQNQNQQQQQQQQQDGQHAHPAHDPMDLSLIRRLDVGPNQCAYCKNEGHWVADCPEKPGINPYHSDSSRGRGRSSTFQNPNSHRGGPPRGRGGVPPRTSYRPAPAQPNFGTTGQTQQRFNNSRGSRIPYTNPPYANRHIDLPNPDYAVAHPGYAYSIPESEHTPVIRPATPAAPRDQPSDSWAPATGHNEYDHSGNA